MRVMIKALAMAAIGIAPALGAQSKTPAPKKAPAPEREGCTTVDGRTECRLTRTMFNDSALMKRPAIGVQLMPTGTARDTLGVFISRVTPKGPAERAGIFEGDRIAAINGVDLRVNAADAGDSYAAELPQRRLSREVAKLSPGNVATLRVYSGGRIRDVQVTVGRAADLQESRTFGLLDGDGPNGAFRVMPGRALESLRELRSLPRMQLEEMSIPRIRMEQLERSRMPLEGIRERMKIEGLAPLREGARVRVLSPSRIKVFEGDDDRDFIVGPDGELILQPSKKRIEKTEAEKKKLKSEKKK
jgi:hypothetical protein